MNITWLCPEIIYPSDSGGRIVQYERVRYAAELGHNITLYLFDNHSMGRASSEELNKVCKQVIFHDYSDKKTRCALRSLVSRTPYCVLKYRSKDVIEQIASEIEEGSIDLIIVEFPFLLVNLPKNVGDKCRVILEQHNVEWETMHSIATKASNSFLRRLFGIIEANKLRKYEERSYKTTKNSKMTFLTREDLSKIESHGVEKVLTPPGGSDYYSIPSHQSEHQISFFANYGYQPNQVSAKWLINEVFPLVKQEISDAKLLFVGKNPPDWLQEAASAGDGITVTGKVEDLKPWYENTAVVLVPISTGGGINIKLLEAASSGRPIIATSFSVKGTIFSDGVELLIRDRADSFAAAVIEVLRKPQRYISMTERCRKAYLNLYSWSAANEKWASAVFDQ